MRITNTVPKFKGHVDLPQDRVGNFNDILKAQTPYRKSKAHSLDISNQENEASKEAKFDAAQDLREINKNTYHS